MPTERQFQLADAVREGATLHLVLEKDKTKEFKKGDTITDFRGNRHKLHSLDCRRVYTFDGVGSYYPSVFSCTVVARFPDGREI